MSSSTASGRDTTDEDEDRSDFNLLGRRLAARLGSSSSNSTISSGYSPSAKELNEIWPLQLNTASVEHYIYGDVVGNGSYAEVRECIDTRSLERCAIKIVNKDYLRRLAPEALLNQMQEIRLLRRFDHENIIKMRDCLFKGSRVYIVLEFCTFALIELLAEQKNHRLTSSLSRFMFNQLCSALVYLHSLGIVHRDVKPHNMLLTNCGTLKLIDFGVSQILSAWSCEDTCTNHEGSPLFQAPEVVSGQPEYGGFKVDVWSAGVTLYLMLFGRYPFHDESLLGLYSKILKEQYEPPIDDHRIPCREAALDLVGRMFVKDAPQRATIGEVVQHPWSRFRSLDWCDGRCEFIELIVTRGSQQIQSTQAANVGHIANPQKQSRDVYRSMSVLPYLYSYHFPDQRARRSSRSSSRSTTPGASDSSMSPQATTVQNADSENVGNPHEIIGEEDVEWGTMEQYNLMKVPLIRANRINLKTAKSFKRRYVASNKAMKDNEGRKRHDSQQG